MAERNYGNYKARNQQQQSQHADAKGDIRGFEDYDYGSNDPWRKRGFHFHDYFGYKVNYRPEEQPYQRAADTERMLHGGRGPRNYQRSPQRITEDVNDRLMEDPELDASEIEVNVNNGEVVLSGFVSDRNAKRRAYDLVEQVPGIRHVENRIRISER